MKIFHSALLLVCFFVLNIHSGSALRCYSCTSATGRNEDCQIRPSKAPTTYCNAGYNYCMTLLLNTNITRACSIADVCSIYANYAGFRSCSICVGDTCNGAKMTSPFNLSLGIGIAIFLSATKFIMY